MDLPLVLCVLLLINRGHSNSCCGIGDVGNIRLAEPRQSTNDGAVQICNRFMSPHKYYISWNFVLNTANTWNMAAAKVACRQLGLPHSTPIITTITLQSEQNIVPPIACRGNETRLYDCLGDRQLAIMKSRTVAGLICDCRNGSLRLIDGPTPWHGRLNVCSNGDWGTVCGDGWTEREAALVCSRLGYPAINARLQMFGQGSGPQYNCIVDSNFANCTILPIQDICNHTGINCSSYPETVNNNNKMENSSTGVLGAITGVLVVALVAVVTAWIISCVYAKSHAPKPSTNSTASIFTNPVYGVGPGTQEVTNNSSVGPTYEQIDDAGNRYDVIRNRADPVKNGEHMTTTPQDYEVPLSNN